MQVEVITNGRCYKSLVYKRILFVNISLPLRFISACAAVLDNPSLWVLDMMYHNTIAFLHCSPYALSQTSPTWKLTFSYLNWQSPGHMTQLTPALILSWWIYITPYRLIAMFGVTVRYNSSYSVNNSNISIWILQYFVDQRHLVAFSVVVQAYWRLKVDGSNIILSGDLAPPEECIKN